MTHSSSTSGKTTILLVEDHPFLRDGITALLRSTAFAGDIFEAESVSDGIRLLAEHRPQLVLTDLRLPDGSGIEILRSIQPVRWHTYGIVLSAFLTEDDLIMAARAGARAFLQKTCRSGELVTTLQRVLDGEDVLMLSLPADLRARIHTKDLTPRELAVLTLIGRGLTNRDIVAVTGLSDNTIKVHLRNVFAKLDVSNRAEAAAVATRRGLVN